MNVQFEHLEFLSELFTNKNIDPDLRPMIINFRDDNGEKIPMEQQAYAIVNGTPFMNMGPNYSSKSTYMDWRSLKRN